MQFNDPEGPAKFGTLPNLLSRKGLNRRHYETAARLRDALVHHLSIDKLIDQRKDDLELVELAKIAIAVAIAKAERESTVFKLGRRPDAKAGFDASGQLMLTDKTTDAMFEMRSTWIARFLQHAARSYGPRHIEKMFEEIRFITFNYDRCIEQYLYFALTRGWQIPSDEAAELVLRKIPIIHVYGDLHPLSFAGNEPSGFGEFNERLLSAPERIKTFTEQIETGWGDRIRVSVKDSDRLIFLGFGFDRQNCEVLFPTPRGWNQQLCGTMLYGDAETDYEFAARENLRGSNKAEGLPDMKMVLNCTAGDYLYRKGPTLFPDVAR